LHQLSAAVQFASGYCPADFLAKQFASLAVADIGSLAPEAIHPDAERVLSDLPPVVFMVRHPSEKVHGFNRSSSWRMWVPSCSGKVLARGRLAGQ
jgi:hypothetical protein